MPTAPNNPQIAPEFNAIQSYNDIACTHMDRVFNYNTDMVYPLAIMRNATSPSTFTVTRNVLHFWPYIPPFNVLIDELRINVTTARTSTTARVGIYKNNHTLEGIGYPDDLYYKSPTTFDMTTTGVKTQSNLQLSLCGGEIYWIAFVCGGGSQNPVTRSVVAGSMWPLGVAPTSFANVTIGYSVSFTYAELPYNISGSVTNLSTAVPMVAARYAKRL